MLTILLAVQGLAQADEQHAMSSFAQQRTPSSQALNALASELGIEPTHPLVQHVVSRARSSAPQVRRGQDEERSLSPIRHIKGDKGISFPKLSELRLPRMPARDYLLKVARASAHKGKEQFKELYKIEPLPKCADEGSIAIPNSELMDALQEQINRAAHQVQFDLLFVDSDFKDVDVDRVFGQYTKLKRYNTHKPDTATFMAKSLRIPCLPFRLRKTGSHLYQHSGRQALLNYDQNPNGRGERIYRPSSPE